MLYISTNTHAHIHTHTHTQYYIYTHTQYYITHTHRDPHQLVPLPRSPSAAAVLQQFLRAKQEKEGTSALQLKRYQARSIHICVCMARGTDTQDADL